MHFLNYSKTLLTNKNILKWPIRSEQPETLHGNSSIPNWFLFSRGCRATWCQYLQDNSRPPMWLNISLKKSQIYWFPRDVSLNRFNQFIIIIFIAHKWIRKDIDAKQWPLNWQSCGHTTTYKWGQQWHLIVWHMKAIRSALTRLSQQNKGFHISYLVRFNPLFLGSPSASSTSLWPESVRLRASVFSRWASSRLWMPTRRE